MEGLYGQLSRFSYQESLKVLETDIQHANALAFAIPRAEGGVHLKMKVVYNHLAPLFLYFLQWIDCSCSCLLPRYLNFCHILVYKVSTDGRPYISKHGRKATIRDFYAVILPSLQRLHDDLVRSDHAVGENLGSETVGKNRFEGRNVNTRSQSCPFCRGSIKRVKSRDLWILTCGNDVMDTETVSRENLLHFYLYIDSLPKDSQEGLIFVHYEYLL
ncbi:unnamed protein product [Thlaspi arvense]|uniref:Uncharacterized protein n=1 Tax=Thlaspi arvense TaxID=13288 RepID=A0AAU9RKX3_THLAR|nr:unnamed protein product [Thlaspi arvense]